MSNWNIIKITFITLFSLLACVSSASAATYYVSTTGSNTSPYDTEAKGATVVKTVIDYIRTNGNGSGDTINIGAGTFNSTSDYFNINNANLANLTIVGAGRTDTIIDTPSGAVFHNLYISDPANGTTNVSNLTLKQEREASNSVYKTENSGTLNLTDVDLISGVVHAEDLIEIRGDEFNCSRCNLYFNYTASKYPIFMLGDSSGTISYSTSQAVGTSLYSNSWILYGSGITNVYNSNIMDSANSGMITANGTFNIKNNVIQSGLASVSKYAIQESSGTITATNNILIASFGAPTNFITGFDAEDTDENNIKTNANLRYSSYGRTGIIVPTVDDSGPITTGYLQELETLLDEYGYKGTSYINGSTASSDNAKSILRSLVAHGTIEIGTHTYSHTNITSTHALNFSQSGGTNCVVSFDGSTISLGCDGTDYDQTYSVEANSTLSNAVSSLNGVKGWIVAISTTGGQTAPSGNALVSGITITEPTSTPTDLDWLITDYSEGHLYNQITYDKSYVADVLVNGDGNVTDPQTGLTFVTNSISFPYDRGSALAKQATIDAGFTSARYCDVGTDAASCVTHGMDIDLFTIGVLGAGSFLGDGTEEGVRAGVRAVCLSVLQNGYVVSLLSHDEYPTIEQWDWVFDEISKFGITVTSMQLAINQIKTSGQWTDDEDNTYSRTYNTYSDFSLRRFSSALDAGVDVGLTQDYLGNPIRRNPDIGAFEYQKNSNIIKSSGSAKIKIQTK